MTVDYIFLSTGVRLGKIDVITWFNTHTNQMDNYTLHVHDNAYNAPGCPKHHMISM